MELRHLRYFVAIAEEMHFRRAAEKLNMTQPPLSQQIQQLEQELGFDLFIRQGRTITLTDAGQVFLDDAHRILASVDTAVNKARQVAQGISGEINVGFVESAVHHQLPDVIREYRTHYPDVVVKLNRMTTNQQVNALLEKHLDVGFCRLPQDDIKQPLASFIIKQEALCAVLPVSHRLASQQQIHTQQLATDDFILFPQGLGTSLYGHIAGVCERAGFTLKVKQQATQFTTIIALVAAEMGVSILPVSVQAFPYDGVRYVALSDMTKVPMTMVWHRDNTSQVFTQFRHLATRFFSSSLQDSF